MDQIFFTLSSDTAHPIAGKPFTITATLDQAAKEPLSITFEKHRVHIDDSGGHYLCVIEDGYFANNGFPGPIDFKAGDTKGTTTVNVLADAKNPSCPPPSPPSRPPFPPVIFPDHLLLTGFARNGKSQIIGEEQIALTIKSALIP